MILFHPESNMENVIWNKNSKEVTLGRCCKKPITENFIAISKESTVSRNHAKLSWDFKEECWKLAIIHKSGVFIHGFHFKQNKIITLPMDKPTPIAFSSTISNGTRIYFLPPKKPFVLQIEQVKNDKLNENVVKKENDRIPPNVEEIIL